MSSLTTRGRATPVPAGLLALALGGFGIGLTEFIVAGVLPDVAAEFGVGTPTAGEHLGFALAHRVTKLLVRSSGLTWTILRNVLYADHRTAGVRRARCGTSDHRTG